MIFIFNFTLIYIELRNRYVVENLDCLDVCLFILYYDSNVTMAISFP